MKLDRVLSARLALTVGAVLRVLAGEPLLMVCAGLALATLLLVRRPALESE